MNLQKQYNLRFPGPVVNVRLKSLFVSEKLAPKLDKTSSKKTYEDLPIH